MAVSSMENNEMFLTISKHNDNHYACSFGRRKNICCSGQFILLFSIAFYKPFRHSMIFPTP